jgi:predicted Zn-dependent protease
MGMKRSLVPVALASLAAAGCATKAELTESQEYFVGRSVAAGSIVQSPLHDDAALEEYVGLVGYTVALDSDRPETFKGYHFGVLRTDEVNAFAAPGGFVFVTLGAIKAMRSEDELAGVLAHEIAHVNLRHPEHAAQRATQKAGVMDVLGAAGSVASWFVRADRQEDFKKLVTGLGQVADAVGQEIVNGYGRESELAADALAVDLLWREGVRYDPSALAAFVGRLPKKDRGAWSTHPDLAGRVEAIEKEIQARGARTSAAPERTKRFMAMTAGLRGP